VNSRRILTFVGVILSGLLAAIIVGAPGDAATRSPVGAPLPSCPAEGVPTGYPIVAISTSPWQNGCVQVYSTSSTGVVQSSPGRVPPPLNAPVVGIAAAADSVGYWLVGADGGVFAYGTGFYGSMAEMNLNAPIVGIAATRDDQGYYLVASDGGVFGFGDATFRGSLAGSHLNAPIVGISIDPLTGGYRLAAADGGVFAFDAPFQGSAVGLQLNEPVVGIATDPHTGGYWLSASDGGVFAFGAPFYGSLTGSRFSPVIGIASDPYGYWLGSGMGDVSDFFSPQG
jgi:hypothetical protein